MRSLLTAGRVVLGGYLAAHGAQKLFGAFGGPGLDLAAQGFGAMGLKPAREMAALAGGSEVVGGVLTATGIADPLGPLMIAGSMTVATAAHRKGGPFAAKGGYEAALTNLAFAGALAAADGHHRLTKPLPKAATAVLGAGAAALTGLSLFQLWQADQKRKAAEVADEALRAAEASADHVAATSAPDVAQAG